MSPGSTTTSSLGKPSLQTIPESGLLTTEDPQGAENIQIARDYTLPIHDGMNPSDPVGAKDLTARGVISTASYTAMGGVLGSYFGPIGTGVGVTAGLVTGAVINGCAILGERADPIQDLTMRDCWNGCTVLPPVGLGLASAARFSISGPYGLALGIGAAGLTTILDVAQNIARHIDKD